MYDRYRVLAWLLRDGSGFHHGTHGRTLSTRDVRHAVHGGQIIEQYPDDYPYPSCLICGMTVQGRVIHVVMSDEGTMSRIITVYFPDVDKWNSDFTVRKERN